MTAGCWLPTEKRASTIPSANATSHTTIAIAPVHPPGSVSGVAPTGESSPGSYNRARPRELAGRYTANLMAVSTQSVWSSPAEPAELQPFRFRGGTRGILLIHGFAGTPPEMRGMGQFLAAGGYDVMGPLLAGHGLTPEAMAATRWPDWVRSAEDALAELRRDCAEVFVGGQSLGGTLALYLAPTHPDVRGVITMAAMGSPVYFRDWRIKIIRGLKYVVRWHVPSGGPDLGDPAALRLLHSYARRPTVCIESLMQLLRVVERELPRVTAPALIMHGRRDRTVDVANAPLILERLRSSDQPLGWVERSGHTVAVDLEHDLLHTTVLDWLNTH